MNKIIYLLIIAMLFSCDCSKKDKPVISEITTVYYFIRHAEKDLSDPNNKDPELTEIGNERAKQWADIFVNTKFDDIYSTDYNRTKQTVFYIAQQKNISIKEYDPKDIYNEDFKNSTLGETVLVVGHSNTTPAFVNAVIGEEKYTQIDDSNNGNLYIATIKGSDKSVQLLTINK